MATSLAGRAVIAAQEVPDESEPGLVLTGHPEIAASLERIARGSQLWRNEVELLRATGRRAVVVMPDQVLVADPRRRTQKAFDNSVLADVSLLPDSPSGIAAVVVINLPLFDELHARRGSARVEKLDDLDRILIHEIYGHAFPYLRAGDVSGRCSDPVAGERAEDACSIRRENAVRAELGLGRRTDYGILGLNLSRPGLGPDRFVFSAGNRR